VRKRGEWSRKRTESSILGQLRKEGAEHGVKHVIARIKHSQTNGKIERFFEEVKRRAENLGSVEAVVRWHNEV